jgi:hypothetical protein
MSMKNLAFKILVVIILFFSFIKISPAQNDTPYKKQIKFLSDDVFRNKKNFKFYFKDEDKNVIMYNFSDSGSGDWNITIYKDSAPYGQYSCLFDSIYQIGYVKPTNSKDTCVIIISSTGENGIVTNEFTSINPESNDILNIKIYYNISKNDISYNYNKTALDPHRLAETKFIVGLTGEYKMIGFADYKRKKKEKD